MAALSEQEMLASLPLPPSAFPDCLSFCNDVTKDPLASETTTDDVTTERGPRHSKLPASALKASAAARAMAAAARSKLTNGGRQGLSPGSQRSSSRSLTALSPSTTAAETTSLSSTRDTIVASDPLASVAFAAGSLTLGLTSARASASSSSFGSLLFSSQASSGRHAVNLDERVSNTEQAAEDEAAALEAAEALRQVTAQQRMKILEELVQHRRSDWNYLKVMHEGSNCWLNVALLREQQVMNHLGDTLRIRRGTQFFYLGMGLGRLVARTHREHLAMGCCQLLEELEFHFASSTVQGMKMMVATSSTLHEPLDKNNSPTLSGDEPFRPSMHKWNQRPVYRRLMTPSLPFPLDYREVLLSLCDILPLVYSKLIEDTSASENMHLFQSIIRFDDRIKKLFIDPVKKEFSAVASQVMAEEMRRVRKSYGSGARDSEGGSYTSTTAASVTASDSDNAPQVSQ